MYVAKCPTENDLYEKEKKIHFESFLNMWKRIPCNGNRP